MDHHKDLIRGFIVIILVFAAVYYMKRQMHNRQDMNVNIQHQEPIFFTKKITNDYSNNPPQSNSSI